MRKASPADDYFAKASDSVDTFSKRRKHLIKAFTGQMGLVLCSKAASGAREDTKSACERGEVVGRPKLRELPRSILGAVIRYGSEAFLLEVVYEETVQFL